MEHMVFGNGQDFELYPSFGKPPGIETIAASLAKINRFTGHTVRPYSVAEHSLLCLEISKKAWARSAQDNVTLQQYFACVLLHDAAECITGDVATPIKNLLGPLWKQFEARVEHHVWSGLAPWLPKEMEHFAGAVRAVDLTALWIERRDLMNGGTGNLPWSAIDEDFVPLVEGHLSPELPWYVIRDRFAQAADELLGN